MLLGVTGLCWGQAPATVSRQRGDWDVGDLLEVFKSWLDVVLGNPLWVSLLRTR